MTTNSSSFPMDKSFSVNGRIPSPLIVVEMILSKLDRKSSDKGSSGGGTHCRDFGPLCQILYIRPKMQATQDIVSLDTFDLHYSRGSNGRDICLPKDRYSFSFIANVPIELLNNLRRGTRGNCRCAEDRAVPGLASRISDAGRPCPAARLNVRLARRGARPLYHTPTPAPPETGRRGSLATALSGCIFAAGSLLAANTSGRQRWQ